MSLDYDLILYARIVTERTEDGRETLETEKYLTSEPRILNPQQALQCGLIQAIEPPRIDAQSVSSIIHG